MNPREEMQHSIRQTEQHLLGAMILDYPTAVAAIDALGLDVNHFTLDHNRALYTHIRALGYELGKSGNKTIGAVNTASLLDWLIDRKAVDDCGGLSRLVRMADDVPSTQNCAWMIGRMMDHAARRQVHQAALKLAEVAWDGNRSIDETSQNAARYLTGITSETAPETVQTIGDLFGAELFSLTNPNRDQRISSGIAPLDEILGGGLASQRLIYLAGRPGHGKTALALAMVAGVASAGHPVFMLSLEMSATTPQLDSDQRRGGDLSERLLCAAANVPIDCARAIKTGTPYRYVEVAHGRNRDADLTQLHRTSAANADWPFEVDDTGRPTWSQVEARIRRAKARRPGLKLVVIDYIGLIRGERGQDTHATMKMISNGLAGLKKELNITILCLAQLNRACEDRRDKRPMISDLRDCGDLEQDADHVLLVQRPCKYDEWQRHTSALWVKEGKGRHGRNLETCLVFDAPTQRIDPTMTEPDPIRAGGTTKGAAF
jgi:replicative DNA helicase